MSSTQQTFCIHWAAFILSFGVGLLYVYLTQPPLKVVVRYPTPFNAGKVTYRDSADTCFQFKAKKVECPADRTKVKKQPIVM